MGCCLSKTTPSPPPLSNVEPDTEPQKPPPQLEKKVVVSVPDETEKEGFVIKHRKSHDKKKPDPKVLDSDSDGSVLVQSANSSDPEGNTSNIVAMAGNGSVVRTSSCTKEEVDAILIQCGRLSRSNSGKCAASGSARKYSGSKRSHDFDKESNNVSVEVICDGGVADDGDERLRRRQSRGSHRRTTPSRSRERDPQSQRSGSGGGRRVSISPGRRSESPNTGSNGSATTAGSNTNNGGGGGCGRPGKMVSVPATITSLSVVEKSNNGEGGGGGGGNSGSVKRVLVKRNVTPPRSRSPARSTLVGATGVRNQPSPSRNSSRKAEHSPSRRHSPYRRTPLTDLDMNSLPFQPLANKSSSTKGQPPLSSVGQNKMGGEANHSSRGAVQGTHRRARSRGGEGSDLAEQSKATGHDQISAPVAVSGPQTLTRTRSSRRSRDFDVNVVETTQNPNPVTNYNSLLLQDIKSFHQKASAPAPPFKLPECVSKACSIVEAVADLNLSSSSSRPVGGGRANAGDELMDPSLHKFVTVSGGMDGEFDEQESIGSNSFVTGGGGSPSSFHRIAAVSQASSSHRSGSAARSRGAGAGR